MTKQVQIKNERGSTLIEFTVVITILLALTFGMIDFGRYVYAISAVRAAARGSSMRSARTSHLPIRMCSSTQKLIGLE